ncbi:hypothetical protein MTsPCn5_06870 [Croceitalea sp. MTPC5]|uniref:hypothetical protein n=1 Tax=Croceitalea sp. MTPC5 TaxID=3056565 RepID=UPI002B373768|nr:hypothetical protein MTsPCn5_06870 [Croceitalea sp. MTPC5]
MKDLNHFHVIELHEKELKKTDGGLFGIFEGVVTAVIAIGLQGVYELGKAHGAEHK